MSGTMSKLRIRNGPYAGREHNLAGGAVTIADNDAGVQILDRSASRFHAGYSRLARCICTRLVIKKRYVYK